MSQTDFPKALLVVSLPPPMTGQSVISATVLDAVLALYRVSVVDTSKETFAAGFSSVARAGSVLSMIRDAYRKSKATDLAYLVLSQSVAGNLRDLLMITCVRSRRIVVHLHGGGIRKAVFDRNAFVRLANRLTFRRVDRVIVLSESLRHQFDGIVPHPRRIHVLPNFAEQGFFVDKRSIESKFTLDRKRLVFLSNMIESKGYDDLVDAYLGLEPEQKLTCELFLAGAFLDRDREAEFRRRVGTEATIHYLGPLDGDERTRLLREAHVFVLPTYYPYEGQPVSILEAYAAGCVVVTTNHGGIADIFADPENGRFIPPRAPVALRGVLQELLLGTPAAALAAIAHRNHELARSRYSRDVFVRCLRSILR